MRWRKRPLFTFYPRKKSLGRVGRKGKPEEASALQDRGWKGRTIRGGGGVGSRREGCARGRGGLGRRAWAAAGQGFSAAESERTLPSLEARERRTGGFH